MILGAPIREAYAQERVSDRPGRCRLEGTVGPAKLPVERAPRLDKISKSQEDYKIFSGWGRRSDPSERFDDDKKHDAD
jgi:hypothetical protein